jgi:hypothetical protein
MQNQFSNQSLQQMQVEALPQESLEGTAGGWGFSKILARLISMNKGSQKTNRSVPDNSMAPTPTIPQPVKPTSA